MNGNGEAPKNKRKVTGRDRKVIGMDRKWMVRDRKGMVRDRKGEKNVDKLTYGLHGANLTIVKQEKNNNRRRGNVLMKIQ